MVDTKSVSKIELNTIYRHNLETLSIKTVFPDQMNTGTRSGISSQALSGHWLSFWHRLCVASGQFSETKLENIFLLFTKWNIFLVILLFKTGIKLDIILPLINANIQAWSEVVS